jgi:hypothetical protein
MKSIVMKILTTSLTGSILLLTSCFTRVGKLVIVSTRNVDSKTEYVLIQKDVNGKGKSTGALEEAIDGAVKQFPTGEFMKNVSIEISGNGNRVKITGDVWGTTPTQNVDKEVTKTVKANIEFKTGDKVTFKNGVGKIVEGTLIGVNQNTAIVEYDDGKKREVTYEKLTKIERTQSNVITEKNNDTPIQKSVEKPVSKVIIEKEIYTVTSDLSMKEGAGWKYNKIMAINKGASVEFLEKTNAEWWKIKYNDKTGFVFAKYLSK